MKLTQPEVDSQLQHMQQLQLRQAQALLHLRLPLEVLVAVPEPAEGLDEHGRGHEEQHQDAEANVGLLLVESHGGPNVQADVEQQKQQTHAGEKEVQPGVPEHTHHISPSAACFRTGSLRRI